MSSRTEIFYFLGKNCLVLLLIFCYLTREVRTGGLQEISIPALGRPFALGDLYDRRKDYIIQGPKLWNRDELSNYIESLSPSTKFDVKASQGINDDLSDFGLSASVKMSFMAGLISVSGSASYLDHRKSRNNQARVSLNYQSTSFTRRLRSELFNKLSFPDVLDNAEDATDVVVAIQYGAGAIFSFDKVVRQNEVTKDIEGTLQVIVKKIPKFKIDGTGKVHIGEEDRKNGENLTCTFHGDFVLKNHPGTYEEAISIYKTLPTFLGERYENSVPITVWLYPLEKLPIKRSTKLVVEIKESLITSVTNVLSHLETIIRQCNDILDSPVSLHHDRIYVKVKRMNNYVQRYVLILKQHLATVTPEIRRGTMSSDLLVKLLTNKENSPFSTKQLDSWISYYSEEVSVLSKIQSLPNFCVNNGVFSSKLLEKSRHTLGLTLRLGKITDDYLTTLENYLLDKQSENSYLSSVIPTKWWRPGSVVLSDLFSLSKSFKQFYNLRLARNMLENAGIQFLVREEGLANNEKQNVSLELFEQGMLKDGHYTLTSAPPAPKAISKSHESIHLVWDLPNQGTKNLKGYKVITYSLRHANDTRECIVMYCKDAEKVTSKNSIKITGLKSQFPYRFTVSAYTELGETSISKFSDEFVTTKCSPGTYHTTKHICEKCNPGTFSDSFGMTSCKLCPVGTYNPKSDAKSETECMKCPLGSYNSHQGTRELKKCLLCPTGMFSDIEGSDSFAKCKQCPKGSYNKQPGANACLKCKTNSYNPSEGKEECNPCPVGKESKKPGATFLSSCESLDLALVLDRKLDAVNDKVERNFKDLKLKTETIANHLSNVFTEIKTEDQGKHMSHYTICLIVRKHPTLTSKHW